MKNNIKVSPPNESCIRKSLIPLSIAARNNIELRGIKNLIGLKYKDNLKTSEKNLAVSFIGCIFDFPLLLL